MTALLRNRRLHALAVCSVAIAALAAGCGGSGSSVPKGDVAVVDGQQVPQSDLDALIAQTRRQAELNKTTFPKKDSPEYKQLLQRAVTYLVQKVEVEQEAKRQHVTVTTKQIDDRMKQIYAQYYGGSRAKYLADLKKRGVTDAQVRDDIALQLKLTALTNKATASVKETDADVRKYYDDHRTDFTQPESRQVAHILVKTKALADSLYQRLQHGADFAALAKKYSTDTGTKSLGGKLTVCRGPGAQTAQCQTVAPFEKVAFSLKTGEVSKPVHTQFGWHVIKALADTKPSRVSSFAEVKANLQQQLLQAKKSAAVSDWQKKFQDFYAKRVEYAHGYEPTTTATPTSTGLIPTTPQTG